MTPGTTSTTIGNPFVVVASEDGDNHSQARNIRNSISLTMMQSHRIISMTNWTATHRQADHLPLKGLEPGSARRHAFALGLSFAGRRS
jgi:hypothetical protein